MGTKFKKKAAAELTGVNIHEAGQAWKDAEREALHEREILGHTEDTRGDIPGNHFWKAPVPINLPVVYVK